MNKHAFSSRFNKCLVTGAVALLFFNFFIRQSDAVTRFVAGSSNHLPASIEFEDIWFYDSDLKKVIPDMDLGWLSVVFVSNLVRSDSPVTDTELIIQMAKGLVKDNGEIVDYFYDINLSEDACFFKLRDGLKRDDLQYLIRELNKNRFVAYAHPAIRIKNRIFAFYNAFEMEWKTGVSKEIKDRIMKQAHVSFDKDNHIYRVDVFQMPLFNAVNLLAEDIHILKATPYLVELVPTIATELFLPINGANIGDKIPFVFSVRFSNLVAIDPSSIANIDVRPAGIQKELFELRTDPYDYVKAATRSPIRITGWLKIFSPGEFEIPPIKIKYTCLTGSDNQVRLTQTNNTAIKISSIVPSKQAENNLIVPSNDLRPDDKCKLYHEKAAENLMVSLSAFLIAMIFIGWFIRNLYVLKKQKRGLRIRSRTDVLEEDLRNFLKKDPSTPHWSYAAALSDMLRQYLISKFNLIDPPAGGSGEIFFDAIKEMIPDGITSGLRYFFVTVDNIVAQEITSYSDMETLRSEILETLNLEPEPIPSGLT